LYPYGADIPSIVRQTLLRFDSDVLMLQQLVVMMTSQLAGSQGLKVDRRAPELIVSLSMHYLARSTISVEDVTAQARCTVEWMYMYITHTYPKVLHILYLYRGPCCKACQGSGWLALPIRALIYEIQFIEPFRPPGPSSHSSALACLGYSVRRDDAPRIQIKLSIDGPVHISRRESVPVLCCR
jgi:hypothetical protein